MILNMKDPDGSTYKWKLWRDKRPPPVWMLESHDGCIRTLEANLVLSAAKLKIVVSNYGLQAPDII